MKNKNFVRREPEFDNSRLKNFQNLTQRQKRKNIIHVNLEKNLLRMWINDEFKFLNNKFQIKKEKH